jgi:hypothetical protein
MSTATDFLNGWVSENGNATMYGDTQMAQHLARTYLKIADRCRSDINAE